MCQLIQEEMRWSELKDLVELANSINRGLPEKEQREKFCDLLLQEFQKLKGRDLAPYLSECYLNLLQPGEVLTLRFPIGAHIFDSTGCNIEANRAGENTD